MSLHVHRPRLVLLNITVDRTHASFVIPRKLNPYVLILLCVLAGFSLHVIIFRLSGWRAPFSNFSQVSLDQLLLSK